jgi:hypothetical protein
LTHLTGHQKEIYVNVKNLNINIAEAHDVVNLINVKNKQNENFLSIVDEKQNILIFSCETNLRFLSTAKGIYKNETFDYCVRFFFIIFFNLWIFDSLSSISILLIAK